MAESYDFGKLAEENATIFLRKEGYQILERNWRYRKAEVDIIAKKAEKIIFVEVKARSGNLVEIAQCVAKKKIKMLVFAANYYSQFLEQEHEIRFDIVFILKKNNELRLEHIKGAFEAMDAN